MIVAESLTRKYGDFVAVDNVSFKIEKGEVVGLLGHNGAGKTTIMKMLTGYLEPSAGKINIDGLDIGDHRLAAQNKIGYLPENCPLYPEMNVIQYLEYVAQLRALPTEKIKSALTHAIDKTGLRDRIFQPIGTLSRGYKQRVGVAQAILHSPEILILDEPTNGLDPSQIHHMRSLIEELSQHSTIIISTHILQEVEAVCDRAIIILQGKIAKDAKLSELQSSNRLLVAVNQSSHIASPVLEKVSGVASVKSLGNGKGPHNYLVEVKDVNQRVASNLAKTAVEKGWELYSLREERRDLETIFREINSAS